MCRFYLAAFFCLAAPVSAWGDQYVVFTSLPTRLGPGGSVSQGFMFDLTTSSNELVITGLDVHHRFAGETFTLLIYTKPGSFEGFVSDPSAWTLASVGTAVSQGFQKPTFIDVEDFALPPRSRTGVYILVNELADPIGQGDLIGNVPPPQGAYGTPDLLLDRGVGVSGFFGSPSLGQRFFDGVLYYEGGARIPFPEPSTLALLGVGIFGLFVHAMRRRNNPAHQRPLQCGGRTRKDFPGAGEIRPET